ncbi:MAG: hypothetical protein PHO48_01660 [Candidatus Gracilibacteria bacterium]|nr:hypothetical protein [Candidatus Gracilibacteria bacterium]MDD5178943.1 hypothetical protein [Candidatus Gracilibacteria bacterium]
MPIEITNQAAIQSATEIQTLTGTPAERVEGYTEKAQEAQAKLQILLEQQATQKSSFLRFQIISTALAEDAVVATDDVAAEIEDLLAEIQTYTELAAEAAAEETDPEALADLLAVVQGAQVDTADIISSATSDATDEVAAVLDSAAADVSDSIAEVDDATAEVAEAIDSGAFEIQVQLDTEAGDFLADGATSINLKERLGAKVRAERKLRNAEREMERVKENLIASGVSAEEADAVIAEKQALVAEAKVAFEAGNFDQAHQLAKDGKKGFTEIQVLANRTKDAKARIAEVKAAAEAGDPVAIAQLEKLAPLVEAGKNFQELLQQRQEVQTEYRAELENIRAETKEEREAARKEFADLKLQEATGDISSEEFKAQQEEFFQQQKEVRADRFEAEKQLREEKIQQLTELKGLPIEEIKTNLNQLQEKQKTQVRNILQDTQKLQEALREGNVETIKAVKQEIQATRQEAKTQIEAQREEVKNKVQEAHDQVKDIKKEIQAAGEEGKEAIKAEVQETKKEIKEGIKEVKQEIQNTKAAVKGEVKQIKEEVKAQVQIENPIAQPPLPPKMPALNNVNGGVKTQR